MQDNKKPSEFTVEELAELQQRTNPDFFPGEVLAETLRKVISCTSFKVVLKKTLNEYK